MALLASRFVSKEKRPTILAITSRMASPPRSSLLCLMRGDGRPGLVSISADTSTSLLCLLGIEIGGVSLAHGDVDDRGSGVWGLKVVITGVRADGSGVIEE
jgi:hypothetical protein